MRQRLRQQGLADIAPRIIVVTRLIPESRGTTCDQRWEHISRTADSHILRVPFRTRDGGVLPQWVSRFQVWPYLEAFTVEAQQEVSGERGRGQGGLHLCQLTPSQVESSVVMHLSGMLCVWLTLHTLVSCQW